MGKDYGTDTGLEPMQTTVTYLKLINVPTMFDIGCSQSDPSQSHLTLNMVDDKSFKIEKSDFLSKTRKFKMDKIEKFMNTIKAIHTNLKVSETTIFPMGIVQKEGTKAKATINKSMPGEEEAKSGSQAQTEWLTPG